MERCKDKEEKEKTVNRLDILWRYKGLFGQGIEQAAKPRESEKSKRKREETQGDNNSNERRGKLRTKKKSRLKVCEGEEGKMTEREKKR